jgi:hypothetical protein
MKNLITNGLTLRRALDFSRSSVAATGFQHSRAPAPTERACVEDQPQQREEIQCLKFLPMDTRTWLSALLLAQE